MVYPMSVNGREGSFYDPWANDQDWGLYFNLKELGAGVFLKNPRPPTYYAGTNSVTALIRSASASMADSSLRSMAESWLF